MLDQVRYQLGGITTSECSAIRIKGAKDQLHRDPFQGFIEALRDLLTDVEQDEREEEGGIELKLDAIGRGFPEVGEIEHPFGDQESLFYPPPPPIQLTDVACGEARRIEHLREVTVSLPPPTHRADT